MAKICKRRFAGGAAIVTGGASGSLRWLGIIAFLDFCIQLIRALARQAANLIGAINVKGAGRMAKPRSGILPTDRFPGRKLHDRIAIAIGSEIVTGVIPQGSLLPTEFEAIEKYQVSRTAYREAIRALSGKGLVSSKPKTGTRVNPRKFWALLDPEILSWMFAFKPTAQAISALFELRMIIEPAAAALAADKRSEEQLAAMRQALDEMGEHGLETPEGRQADGRFHSLILEATGNEFLMAMIDPIVTAIRWTTLLKMESARPPSNPIDLHTDLYNAISRKNLDDSREFSVILLQHALEDTSVLVE